MSLDYSRNTLIAEDVAVVKVPMDRLDAVWRYAFPYINIGMNVAPELRIGDIVDGLSDQSIQLWIVLDGREIIAAFLTSIERDRMDWVVSLYALGGSRVRDWLHLCDREMTHFARSEDAVRVRMYGRPAWKRLLPSTFAITGNRNGHNVYERAVP